MSERPCPHRDDVGAWVLGALGEPDGTTFAAHLDTCPACRGAVAELQSVADALPRGAPPVAPPSALKDRIMRVVEAEAEVLRAAGSGADRPVPTSSRRRLRPPRLARPLRVALPVAAALAAATIALVVVLGGGADVQRYTAQAPAGASVTVEVRHGDGRLVIDDLPPAPAGRVYQVWTLRPGGAPEPTRTLFTVPRDGDARVAIDADLAGVRQVLVTDEPPGGSATPTRAPVISGTLS